MPYRKLVFVAVLALSVECISLSSSLWAGLLRPHESVILIRSVKQDFNYVTPWKRAPLSRISGSGFVVAGD